MQRPQREAAYWFSPQGLLGLLSCSIQDHQPKDDIAHSEMSLSLSIINQENAPQACLQTNLVGAFFLTEFPHPK